MIVTLLSKKIYKKDNAIVIFFGNVHAAPHTFYINQNKELDSLSVNGYEIWYEGITGSLNPDLRKKYPYIVKYLDLQFRVSINLQSTKEVKAVDQSSARIMPINAKIIDISWNELVTKLAEIPFEPDWFTIFVLKIFIRLPPSKNIFLQVKEWILFGIVIRLLGFTKGLFNFNQMNSYFIIQKEKAYPVLLTYRNSYVINAITKAASTNSTLKLAIVYGNDHILGMGTLLEKEGWNLVNTESINVNSM